MKRYIDSRSEWKGYVFVLESEKEMLFSLQSGVSCKHVTTDLLDDSIQIKSKLD